MKDLIEYLNSLFLTEEKCKCSDVLDFKEEGEWILISRDYMPYKKIHYLSLLGWNILGEEKLIDFLLE